MLGQLINRVGLEDAAELVALASTEQLAEVFDEDLWQSAQPGEDARFDSGRFLLWLEVMLEAGEAFVAKRLAELPQDLLTLAVHRHVLVISLADLQSELTAGDDEAEASEKAFESCLSEEIDEYQLIWRGGDGWDDLLSALLAMDRDEHELCVGLLERCAHLSREHIEDNGGLYEVLSSAEMLETDLGAERETRRAERGHVAPSAAAAFLRLARRASPDTPFAEHDPLTRAYFRQLSRQPAAVVVAPPPPRDELRTLLAGAGIGEGDAAPRLLIDSREAAAEPLLITALRQLRDEAVDVFVERSEELAYLSNVLLAAASFDGRRLRPGEAVQYAMDGVGLGLFSACGEASVAAAAKVLSQQPCDGLFRLAIQEAQKKSRRAGSPLPPALLARVRRLLQALPQ